MVGVVALFSLPNTRYTALMKRTFDVIASIILILLLFPLMMAVMLAVLCSLGWPVLFAQERPGMNGRLFRMHKFRTMSDSRDSSGNLLADENRLARFGLFLRKTSLDELPELFDVLRGRMSLVGPRPLLPEYMSLYNADQARRHEVRPGVTGWAQVMGRNSLSWEKKFTYDVWYVENRTFLLDMKILFRTAGQVFKTSQATGSGSVTMTKFTGSEKK